MLKPVPKIQREKETGCLIIKLKNLGNFKYTIKVLREQSRDLIIVCRIPSKETMTSLDYLPCIYCYGFSSKEELWRHTGKCSSKNTKLKDQQGIIARFRFLLAGGIDSCAEKDQMNWKKQFSWRCIKTRCTLLLWMILWRTLIKQLGYRRTNYASQRMWQQARLKTKVNALLNEENDLHCYITRKHFYTVVKAVQDLAGFHQNEQKISVFSTSSLALNLGHGLVKVVEIRRGNAIKKWITSWKENVMDIWNSSLFIAQTRHLQYHL